MLGGFKQAANFCGKVLKCKSEGLEQSQLLSGCGFVQNKQPPLFPHEWKINMDQPIKFYQLTVENNQHVSTDFMTVVMYMACSVHRGHVTAL